MAREHIVSIRLTDEEHRRLLARGRASDVVRGLIRKALSPPLPRGESVGYEPPPFMWFDGTANSGVWPDLNTRRS